MLKFIGFLIGCLLSGVIGYHLNNPFMTEKDHLEYKVWKDVCDLKWETPCNLHYSEIPSPSFQIGPKPYKD